MLWGHQSVLWAAVVRTLEQTHLVCFPLCTLVAVLLLGSGSHLTAPFDADCLWITEHSCLIFSTFLLHGRKHQALSFSSESFELTLFVLYVCSEGADLRSFTLLRHQEFCSSENWYLLSAKEWTSLQGCEMRIPKCTLKCIVSCWMSYHTQWPRN